MSEFGTGYAYCLGLFLAHAERRERDKETCGSIESDMGPEMWFNAAADHLFELQVPWFIWGKSRTRIIEFRSQCLKWRGWWKDQERPTWANVDWAVHEAKALLMLGDVFTFVKTSEAVWS